MSATGSRILHLLRADPDVYRPVARAYALIVSRRSNLGRQRRGWISRKLSPFYFLCFTTTVTGSLLARVAFTVAPPLLAAAAMLTFGAIFLMFVVILDDIDVLVNPSEYLVLAAHPHDGWSVLLAKIVVVGRSLAILGLCHFLPGAIACALVLRSPLAGLAFLFGAGCLTAAVATGGMLFAAALLSLWGRRALDRILPVVQALYMVIFLFSVMGRQMLRHAALPQLSATGLVQWVLPSVWFVWPLELAAGLGSGATWIRAALASASAVLVVAIGSGWIGNTFGERLLDPPPAWRKRRTAQARPRPARRRRIVARSPEMGAVLKLISAHLRSDLLFRSNLMATTLTPLIMLSSIFLARNMEGWAGSPMFAIGMLGFGLTVMLGSVNRVMTLSSRPGALWCVLASPAGRSRLSFATITAIRSFIVLPYLVLMAVIAIVVKAGSAWSILLTLAGMGVLAEALLRFWRGFYKEVPFSQPMRSAGKMGGGQLLAMMGGTLMGVGAIGTLALAQYFGLRAQGAVVAIFLVGLVFASLWARWRVSRDAESFEIRADEVRV